MKTFIQAHRFSLIFLVQLAFVFVPGLANADSESQGLSEVKQSKFPPPWVLEFKGSVDATKIRRNAWDAGIEEFILEGTDQSRKEAVKLAYESGKLGTLRKQQEIKTYFLAGEYDWALYELEKLGDRKVDDWKTMSAIYSHFGEYTKSLDALSHAIQLAAASPPLWRPLILAQLHESQGDVYAQAGDTKKSRESYERARFDYGRIEPEKASLRVAKPRGLTSIKSKLDMLDIDLLQAARFADGMFQDHSFGYSGDIVCWVETADGKIKDIKLQHKEKSDLNASKKVPEAILEAQNPKVDVITGATVTSNAIKSCVFESLKHAAGIQ